MHPAPRSMRGTPPLAGDARKLPRGPLAAHKGLRYPPDPPSVSEIVSVMNACGHDAEGLRLRALIVVP